MSERSEMPLFDRPFPESPGVKNLSSDTSVGAARSVAGKANEIRARIFAAIRGRPMTSDEASAKVGVSFLTGRPRCTELKALGLIVDSGERRKSSGGRPATVWRARLASDTAASFAKGAQR